MSHGFLGVTLQTTEHEVIVHDFQEVTPERQVISHGRTVMSMVGISLMIGNTYHIFFNIIFS